jgi:hypothetical protein
MFVSANIGRVDPVEKYMMQVFFFHLQRGNGYINQGRRRTNGRVRRADREDSIRRTVYVSELDHTVSTWCLLQHSLLYIIYFCVVIRSKDVDRLLGDRGETCWYLYHLWASKLFHLKRPILTWNCTAHVIFSVLYCLCWSTEVIKQSLLSDHVYWSILSTWTNEQWCFFPKS